MKVLGIGWAKTGTTSLGNALKLLGYNHKSQDLPLVSYLRTSEEERIYELAKQYDSFEDWPWLLLYRQFDERFPGTKFILTLRDSESWIISYRKQLARSNQGQQASEWRSKLYDLPFPNVTDRQLIDRYERHITDVRAYFADRPDDLLMVNWAKGDGWAELCGFLGKPVPNVPFPHANVAPRFPTLRRLARPLKRAIGMR
ncbi:sulfotransferase family protein [Qipengyuania qiaonensis]|uniref:Sulfotransferase family protein n=1 Tax=Qipengyuania qiaonensis TaxID=2867240 RepID=A0ABS7J5R1_9SPHN|nr:sulfotransferase family protein [Qipengyuania qiaonensis]MBX7482677.1 hypothetical protein [Qipengyuania qiaonensis]